MGNDCGRVTSPDSAVHIVRMFTDNSGNTRFKRCMMQSKPRDGSVGEFSDMVGSRKNKDTGGLKLQFAITRVPSPGEGQTILSHAASRKLLILTMAGRMEFRSKDILEAEQEDGVHRVVVGPGDVLLVEDFECAGHIWDFVPDADDKSWPWVRCYIRLDEEYNRFLSCLRTLPKPALGWELSMDLPNQTLALLQSSYLYSSANAVLIHMCTNKGGHTRFRRRLLQTKPQKGSGIGHLSELLVNINEMGNNGDMKLQFAVTPAPKDGDEVPRALLHTASRQQLIITIEGQMRFRSSTVSDDDEEHKVLISPGDVLLADNLDGVNYMWDFVADPDGHLRPWKRLYIQIGDEYDNLVASLCPVPRGLDPRRCPTTISCPANQACPGGVMMLPECFSSSDAPAELVQRRQF